MRPFQLHTVLKYRQNLEDRAMQRLARVQQEAASLREERQEQQERLEQAQNDLEGFKREGANISRIVLYRNHIHSIQARMDRLDSELHKAEQRVERKREELLRASRSKRLLEKLKERQDHRYRRHLEDLEESELDEIAVLYSKR